MYNLSFKLSLKNVDKKYLFLFSSYYLKYFHFSFKYSFVCVWITCWLLSNANHIFIFNMIHFLRRSVLNDIVVLLSYKNYVDYFLQNSQLLIALSTNRILIRITFIPSNSVNVFHIFCLTSFAKEPSLSLENWTF